MEFVVFEASDGSLNLINKIRYFCYVLWYGVLHVCRSWYEHYFVFPVLAVLIFHFTPAGLRYGSLLTGVFLFTFILLVSLGLEKNML